jgi:hypothetical protein
MNKKGWIGLILAFFGILSGVSSKTACDFETFQPKIDSAVIWTPEASNVGLSEKLQVSVSPFYSK